MTCCGQTGHAQTPKIVNRANGQAQQLNRLIFGSLLPPKIVDCRGDS